MNGSNVVPLREPWEEGPPAWLLDGEADSAPASKSPATTPSLRDRLRAMQAKMPLVRLATGIETFDQASRGGLPVPRLVVIGGAPGAGKTSLLVWKAWRWVRDGIPVAMLAIDEGADGLLMRIAQIEHFDRDKLEAGDAEEWSDLEARIGEWPLVVGDESDAPDALCARLPPRAPTAPAVLIVDSLQALAMTLSDEIPIRERVNLLMRGLKRIAETERVLVLVTSELARGAYRARNAADRIDDLAAFKESGGIEYGAETAFVLRSVAEMQDEIDVTVVKHRAHRKPRFRLRMDPVSATFTEVEAPEEEADPMRAKAKLEQEKFAKVRARIFEVLQEHTDLRSRSQVFRHVGGQKQVVLDALRELEDGGQLVKVDGCFRRGGRT